MKKFTLALALFLPCFWLSAQKVANKSVLDIKNNDTFNTFSVLSAEMLSKYSLFFTGEDHRFLETNSQIELKMFKYLHKTAGVRVFIMEFGQSFGYIANKYVQTGDTVLENILSNHSFAEYFDLFKNLRKFYVTLPDDEKFRLVSVDLEREPIYPIKLLEYLLPADAVISDSIKVHVEALKAISEYYDYENTVLRKRGDFDEYPWRYNSSETSKDTAYKKTRIDTRNSIYLIIDNYRDYKDDYKKMLGDNFELFDEAVESLHDHFGYVSSNEYYSSNNTAQHYLEREYYMEKNVLKLFAENPGVKAFGQFGRCHTQRQRQAEECSYYYFNSLATRLNSDKSSVLYGNVFSCPMYYPAATDFMDANVKINNALKALVDSAKLNEVTIYIPDPTDSTWGTLTERFNAIIINYHTRFGTATKKKKSKSYNNWDERLIALAETGIGFYNFSNVNNALGTHFSSTPYFFGASLNYAINWDINWGPLVHWYPAVEQKINDSLTVSLSGVRAKFRYGTDLIRSGRYDLNLQAGMGYERWQLEVKELNTGPKEKNIFGSSINSVYTNPAFIMDVGVDFRAHFSFVTAGVFGSFQGDISNKRWLLNGTALAASPKFSMTSFVVGVSLGFNITVY